MSTFYEFRLLFCQWLMSVTLRLCPPGHFRWQMRDALKAALLRDCQRVETLTSVSGNSEGGE